MLLAGVTGTALYMFWRRSNRSTRIKISETPEIRAISSSDSSVIESDELDSQLVDSITEILKSIALQKQPSPGLIASLQTLLAPLSEDVLAQIKLVSDEISFGISEWVFYHTLRTNRKLDWNPVTGIVDQTMTPDQRMLGEKLARSMRKAYWATHLADLNAGVYTCVLERLVELDERINSFRPARMRAPVFDLGLAQQQVDHKTFDRSCFHSLVSAAVNALYELESPAAHDETKAWYAKCTTPIPLSNFHEEIVDSLSFLFSQLDLLDSELANFKSSQMSLALRRTQERTIFQRLLETRTIRATQIRAMLCLSVDKEALLSIGSRNSAIFLCFKKFLLSYMASDGAVTIPESLSPDFEKLERFRSECTALVLLAAFSVGFHSQMTTLFGDRVAPLLRDVEGIKKFLTSISAQLRAGPCDVSTLVDEVVAELIMKVPNLTISPESLSAMKKGFKSCVGESSQVRLLYQRRVAQLLETALVPGPLSVISSASMGSQPWFLSIAVEQLNDLVVRMTEFMADHLQVYLPVYGEILVGSLMDSSQLNEVD